MPRCTGFTCFRGERPLAVTYPAQMAQIGFGAIPARPDVNSQHSATVPLDAHDAHDARVFVIPRHHVDDVD